MNLCGTPRKASGGCFENALAVGLLLAFWVWPADAAEICAPDENPYICTLLEQRDAQLNAFTNVETERRTAIAWWAKYLVGLEIERARLGEWLKNYIKGVEDQRRQASAEAEIKAARAAEAGKRGTR